MSRVVLYLLSIICSFVPPFIRLFVHLSDSFTNYWLIVWLIIHLSNTHLLKYREIKLSNGFSEAKERDVFCSQADQCRISVCYILEIQETELRKLDKSGMCVRNTSSLLLCFLIPSSLFITLLLCFFSLLYLYHFFVSTLLFLSDNCIRFKYSIRQYFFTPSSFPL